MNNNFTRRDFLKLTGIAAISVCLPNCTKSPIEKPNVIVMYIDDLDFRELGYYGNKALTPNIDKLANEGAILNRYYATSPVCTPSRYTTLTGKYAGKCKKLQSDYPLDDPAFIRWNTFITEDEVTIAHRLKKIGYTTGIVGKYHLFGNEALQKKNPKNPQIDDPVVLKNLKHNYKAAQDNIKKYAGFDYAESIYANNLHTLQLPDELHYHNMDWETKSAVEFIDQNKDNPFYLYMATTIPHDPPAVDSMKQSTRVSPAGFLDKEINVQPSRKNVFNRVKKAGLPEKSAPMVWLDDAIGVVMNKLDEHGLRENTMIIFASDHGNERGKMTLYEDGAKCPAFIYWKDHIKPGQQVNKITGNVDIVPTILDACNIKTTAEDDLDGMSWLNLFNNKKIDWRKSLYLEVCYTRGIVTEDWKYIAIRYPKKIQAKITPENEQMYNHEGTLYSANNPAGKKKARYGADKDYPHYFDHNQLYNISEDPNELVNLFHDEKYKNKADEFQKILKKVSVKIPHHFGEF